MRWTVLLTLALTASAWLVHRVAESGWRNGRLVEFPSFAISGDEPHYMLVVHSLVFDRDLQLGPDYLRVARGGFGAGRRFRGASLDHHTVLFDPTTGKSKLWQEVFDWRVRECRAPGCEGWRRLTQDFLPGEPRVEVSAHPVAFSAFLAAALAPFRPRPEQVEPWATLVVQLLAWLGLVLTFLTGRAAGFTRPQALAAAALVLASPWLAYARSFFVELPAGLLVVAGLLALQRGRPWAAGLAAGVLFAIKPPLLFFGAGWFLERLWAGKRKEALSLALPLGAVGLGVGLFNRFTAGRWVVAGTSPWEWANGLDGVVGNLFHAAHGVLPWVPWVAVSLAALALNRSSTLARQVALPFVPYFAMIAANKYLGETCYGPRYWVVLLPALALAAVDLLRAWPRKPVVRAAALGTLALLGVAAAVVALPGAVRYAELWDRPVWEALLLPGRSP